jgi:hypothetical protein
LPALGDNPRGITGRIPEINVQILCYQQYSGFVRRIDVPTSRTRFVVNNPV